MISITLCLVAALALQTPSPAAAPSTLSTPALADAYNFFIRGRVLEGQGDMAGAIAAHRQALVLAPGVAEIHAELAGLYARDGKGGEAVAEADAALKIDPKNREAHRILGFVQAAMAEQGSPASQARLSAQALDHLEQAMAGGLHDPGLLLTLGRLEVDAGQNLKAADVLVAFLLDQPRHPEGLMLLAGAYDNMGRLAQAATQLEELVSIQPDLARAQTWLADVYERAGRWSDAADRWAVLAKQTPRTMSYRTRRATALVNAGDAAGGRQVLLDATRDAPRDIATWYLLAQTERRMGNAQGAEDAARRITEIDAADPRGPLSLAEARLARQDYRGAVETLDPLYKALGQAPASIGAFTLVCTALGAALQAAGDPDRAILVLEDAHQRDAADDDLIFALATAYEKGAKYDRAERLLRDRLAKDPGHAMTLNYLGYLLADHTQKLDEAVGLIARAIAAEPDNPSYLDSLGWAYFKQGKVPDAVSPMERAARALPKASLVQSHLGEVYFQLKRYRDAADAWTRALAGDRAEIDVAVVTQKRDRARELAR